MVYNKEAQRQYYLSHKDECNNRNKNYRMNHEKELRLYQKIYRKKHHVKCVKQCRDYYYEHRDELLIKSRKNHKIYWIKNKDKKNKERREKYKQKNGQWHKDYHKNRKMYINEMARCRYYQFYKEEKGYKTRSIKIFEPFEDDILYKYYGKILNSEIIKNYLPYRNLYSIQRRANFLGLTTHIKHSEDRKKIMREMNNANAGKTYEELYGEETAKELKHKLFLRMNGKNNPAYKHGKANEPYPMDFNNNLREFIRNRDKKCMICKMSRNVHKKYYKRDLIVHHIDGDKHNLDHINLISLCIYHHGKIQFIQDHLKDYFYSKIIDVVSNKVGEDSERSKIKNEK